MIKQRQRQVQDSLSDALAALAVFISDANGTEDTLNRLTRGLADCGVACALLVQEGNGPDLRLERATLPLAPDVWGRSLRLPQLAFALNNKQASARTDVEDAFTETTPAGVQRGLLTETVTGTLIVAPLRLAQDRPALLCLTSPQLNEQDREAASRLALQLASGLREFVGDQQVSERTASGSAAAPAADVSLFHELTRRLSYSLGSDEVVAAALEVLAPAVGFQVAATVTCDGEEDTATVYAPSGTPEGSASAIAEQALDAFLRLAGQKHRDCARPPYRTVALSIEVAPDAPPAPPSAGLDAPLVTTGEVSGLLRIGAPQPDAFDTEKEATFYTVANQISLALERVAAQRTAERAQLASLAESLSDGIVLVDADLRVTSLNESASRLLESLAEGDTLGHEGLAVLAREALSSRAPTELQELPAGSSAAERRYLKAMAAPLAGSPEGSAAVVIIRDVTEERLIQERLLQSEKMVSVGHLVSGVAHELNNPLTGIMGFAQLLLARDLDDATRRDLTTIHAEAERATKIVQNLLSFARRKHAQKEMADLNVLLERVLELCTYELRVKGVELELELDPTLPQTMVDANQIQQVFFNIIINAEQAMLAGGEPGTVSVTTRRENDHARLTFHDDGPGMDADTLRRIFDPFFTTKEAGEGTGLGLTISYGIVDEHGGRIWAESRSGHGTSFIIELPLLQGTERPSGPAAEPEARVIGRSILVVDDEESIRRLLGSILETDGHLVDAAGNGKEALERIRGGHFDVVITDIKMPELDGRGLYERLLDIDSDLAAHTIFITGDTVNPDTRDFLQRVRNPCLAKPFGVDEVRDTLSAVLSSAK